MLLGASAGGTAGNVAAALPFSFFDSARKRRSLSLRMTICAAVLRMLLRASAGGTAGHTSIAAAVSGHNGAADVTARRVAHIDELFHRIGCVVNTAVPGQTR